MSDFFLRTGERIKNIDELSKRLESMSADLFSHHVTKGRNDFSEWIKKVLKEKLLAEKIYHVTDKNEMRAIINKYLVDKASGTLEAEFNVMDDDFVLGKGDVMVESYHYYADKIPITIRVVKKKGDFVPTYNINISQVSPTTQLLLEKIRNALINEVNLGIVDINDAKRADYIDNKFRKTIGVLIQKYFPDIDDNTEDFLIAYLIEKSLGLGEIELLMDDSSLEEIVINSASDPVWVFHRKHGWLRTNVFVESEDKIKHYSAMIGRKVGRSISVLEPLLDAHMPGGDRVNSTLMPISTSGNTITIRKFATDPWTITKFINTKTMTSEAASLIWLAIQYELSILIAGGTASGKTSTLNCFANFFPPNQRLISIEDTREIQLPSFLHWVSMNTRLPNAEGKGEVEMSDLLVNSLRMRPDRIIVGEVRRQREAETLFEAIHTGHSCYATFHANNVSETVERLTNPPINVPRTLLPAISLIVVQFRNRRIGTRRTFQIAEILPDSTFNVLMQYNPKKDYLEWKNKSKWLFQVLKDYTGHTDVEIMADLKEKQEVLDYLVENDVTLIEEVGRIIAEYYTAKEDLMKFVRANRKKGKSSANTTGQISSRVKLAKTVKSKKTAKKKLKK